MKNAASVLLIFLAHSKHGCKNNKAIQLQLLIFHRSNSVKKRFQEDESVKFRKKAVLQFFKISKVKKILFRNFFTNWEIYFYEISSHSNFVNVSDCKIRFFWNCGRIREVSLFSCILRHICNKPQQKFRKWSQYFCWSFPNFFNSFWTLGKSYLAGVSRLQSKCTLKNFEISLSSTNKLLFWKYIPISSNKISYF